MEIHVFRLFKQKEPQLKQMELYQKHVVKILTAKIRMAVNLLLVYVLFQLPMVKLIVQEIWEIQLLWRQLKV